VHDFEWSQMPEDRLPALTVPTLVIRGTRDRLVRGPPRRAVPGLSGAALVVIDDAGHAANEECPEPVNAALLEFLATARPPRSLP
jgi:pimeloyl-ACP methyl ester carboxylesterase